MKQLESIQNRKYNPDMDEFDSQNNDLSCLSDFSIKTEYTHASQMDFSQAVIRRNNIIDKQTIKSITKKKVQEERNFGSINK